MGSVLVHPLYEGCFMAVELFLNDWSSFKGNVVLQVTQFASSFHVIC